MFKGSFTALITPFKNGQVDDQAFTRLVEWQIEEGTHGLVPVGTTGECPTLSHDEHKHVIELCIKAARKRVPVIAGAGSNSTAEAIDFMNRYVVTRVLKTAGGNQSRAAKMLGITRGSLRSKTQAIGLKIYDLLPPVSAALRE